MNGARVRPGGEEVSIPMSGSAESDEDPCAHSCDAKSRNALNDLSMSTSGHTVVAARAR